MKYCAFLNNNKRVVNVGVFDTDNFEVAELIKAEQGYKSFVFFDDNVQMYSIWDGKKLTPPSNEFIENFNLTGDTEFVETNK